MSKTNKVLWEELFPDAFLARLRACPVVFVPFGLCEPHGPIAALGLDLVKARALCERAAQRLGGIVAPAAGFHIHECGYHARWLEEVLGEANGHMTAMPPRPVLYHLLYQLRAYRNAGFAGAVVVTGHAGGNEADLRRVADAFTRRFGFAVEVRTDGELAHPHFHGDHAGRFEISELMHLRPELVDMDRLGTGPRVGLDQTLFAQGGDAHEASERTGAAIVACILDALEPLVQAIARTPRSQGLLGYVEVEALWQELLATESEWSTAKPKPGQREVSANSQWKPFEHTLPR